MSHQRDQTLFEPRVAAASLSGMSDASWADNAADHVGCAFLGGIALDESTRKAARKLVVRDRDEFLPADPHQFIDAQLRAIDEVPVRPAVNVRSSTLVPLEDAADICRDYDAILEINAHCRQDEMCEARAGEALLHQPGRLCKQVEAATATGATVSVKVRTEVEGVDLPLLAADLDDAGADVIHVDAMDSESVVADVVGSVDAFVIANNEVRDAESVTEYLEHGADAVSVGRLSDDPRVLQRVLAATEAWFKQEAQP